MKKTKKFRKRLSFDEALTIKAITINYHFFQWLNNSVIALKIGLNGMELGRSRKGVVLFVIPIIDTLT